MAVEAGRAALAAAAGAAGVAHVVLVTRDLPLLEGGNSAALLGGLGLPPDTWVAERVGGGAPAALDAVLSARPRTLVLAADLDPGGGGPDHGRRAGPAAGRSGHPQPAGAGPAVSVSTTSPTRW